MGRSRLARVHLESNRQSRDGWTRFEPHRARVTGLVTGVVAPGGRVCVLGAGNVNDLDLARLLSRAGSVDLVDIDTDALVDGVARQHLAGDPRVRLHGGVDLSGVLHLLGHERDPDRLAAAVDTGGLPLPEGTFDVAVSAGVLTQLLQPVVDARLGPEVNVDLTLRLRDRHLLDLTALTRAGGRAVLITDTVPTSSAPHLLDLEPGELEPAMAALVADGNFFTGTNPYRVVAVLEEHETLAPLVEEVRLHDPWLWAVTPDRHHLTYAVTWRRQR